jgi:hypothetical protein
LFQSNNAYKLISYPYYTKYTQPGDKMGFCHIDVNIPKLLYEGRGRYMIQGSVSLDDESEIDSTIIIKGFHKEETIKGWYERWKTALPNGHVHNFRKVYNQDDVKKYGDFTPVPCKAGQVRITTPHLPHGAQGPAAGYRRTILPWYVRVQGDNETLEIVEAGTWSELSLTHTAKTMPPATPSGYKVQYGKPPYRFPGSGSFLSDLPLSQALVGRRRWDDEELLDQVEQLVKSSNEYQGIRTTYQMEVCNRIPDLWRSWVK